MNKLTLEYQKRFAERPIFDPSILDGIDPAARLNALTTTHPQSSSAACLNVLGSMVRDPRGLARFLDCFGLKFRSSTSSLRRSTSEAGSTRIRAMWCSNGLAR